MNWWKLFICWSQVEWGPIPVSRVRVPYTSVTLCEHTSHSETVAGLCAQKFPGSTVTPSPAHLTWTHRVCEAAPKSLSSGMALWMQRVKGRGAGSLALFTSDGLAEGTPVRSVIKRPSDSAFQEDSELAPCFSKRELQHWLQGQQKYTASDDVATSTN